MSQAVGKSHSKKNHRAECEWETHVEERDFQEKRRLNRFTPRHQNGDGEHVMSAEDNGEGITCRPLEYEGRRALTI